MGCCFAQNLRKLAYDGAPSSNLYGAELQSEFINLGYELFLDRDTFDAKFLVADIFDRENPLKELDGKINMMYIGEFLHLFNFADQVMACERIVAMMTPGKGAMLFGGQSAHENAKEISGISSSRQVFKHNVRSFKKMWVEIGEKTGSTWNVTADLKDRAEGIHKIPFGDPMYSESKWLTFQIERLS